jgi:hypothetical protein
MSTTPTNAKYIELSITLRNDLARKVQSAVNGPGDPDAPLFVVEANTLTMGVKIIEDDAFVAANEAHDILWDILDDLEIPEVSDPFRINITDTDLLWENIAPGQDDDPFDEDEDLAAVGA